MKKIYSLLLAMMGFLTLASMNVAAQEQDEVVIQLNNRSGDWTDWNNNPNSPWAKTWESNSEDPHIVLHQVKNANNMNYWDGTNIKFYNSVGGSTKNEDYSITVSAGWKISAVSLDFVSENANGISVTLSGTDPVECYSTTEPEHAEVTGLYESEVIMNVATLGDGDAKSTTNFARTSNFFVTLVPLSARDRAEEELIELVTWMSDYLDAFEVGSEPGFYPEAAVEAFQDAYADAGGYSSNATAEDLIALKNALQEAYDAVVASRIPVQVADGYYRFKAAMDFTNNGESVNKYMFGVVSGTSLRAMWATPDLEDAEDAIQVLWKVTNKDGFYDVQNMFHDGRFNNLTRSSVATLSPESTNLMAFDPVTTEDGVTILNIRVSTQEPSANAFLHQTGHSSGAGVSGNVIGWNAVDGSGPVPASQWVLEPVDEAEALAIIEAYAPVKERKAFEAAYEQLRNEATATLENAKDYILTPLITENSQFSSPWTESSEGSLDNLIDGNASTYWHSAWSGGNVDPHTHYLQVALNEPTHELVRMTITRRPVANDHIILWGVFGSNDAEAADEDWEELASLATPYGNNTETVNSELFDTKGYQYLRFYIDDTTTKSNGVSRGYGHVSEFQLYEAAMNPNSQYALMGEAATNLEAVLKSQKEIELSDVQQTDFDALQIAYDAFTALYVDPSELRQLIASVEKIAGGVVVGTQPGFWTDSHVGDALAKTVADAKTYDEKGVYVAAQSNQFIETLLKQADDLMAAAIGIQTGKWYRIRFGTEDEYEQYGWDKVAGEPQYNDDEVEIDEALFGKYVTVANYETNDDGVRIVVPIEDAEDAVFGNGLFLDALEDIEENSLAEFRFVAVADTAFLIQNRATGLFLRSRGEGGQIVLGLHPVLFNVKAIGYGQNVIAGQDLLTGASLTNMHGQRNYNAVVLWNASEPGSRSGFYIEEAGDVDANYKGTDFKMNLKQGSITTYCFPINVSAVVEEGEQSNLYTVSHLEEAAITLNPLMEVAAGRPFIVINGDTEDYDAENEALPVAFRHGYDIAREAQNDNLLKGTFAALDLGAGYLVASANEFVITNLMSGSILANTAYITSGEKLSSGAEISYTIVAEPDGIAATLARVAKGGAIYSVDGRLISRQGQLSDLKTLGRGIYIINGAKVIVK